MFCHNTDNYKIRILIHSHFGRKIVATKFLVLSSPQNEGYFRMNGIFYFKLILNFADGYTKDDEFAMKAKINFTGSVVGDHPNILKFIGAVVNDEACKFFWCMWSFASLFVKTIGTCKKSIIYAYYSPTPLSPGG